jgi:hypothetical protein
MIWFYWKAFIQLRRIRHYTKAADNESILRLTEYVNCINPDIRGNGQISAQERNKLIEWIIQFADIPGPIVEIGTSLGFSAQALCEGVIRSGKPKTVYTVDNYGWNPVGMPSFRHKMHTDLNLTFASSLTDLIIVDSTGEKFYQTFDQRPSIAFIDADHSYASVKKDLEYFKQVGTPVIIGHDYNFPDVAKAVQEVLGDQHLTVFGGTLFLYEAH